MKKFFDRIRARLFQPFGKCGLCMKSAFQAMVVFLLISVAITYFNDSITLRAIAWSISAIFLFNYLLHILAFSVRTTFGNKHITTSEDRYQLDTNGLARRQASLRFSKSLGIAFLSTAFPAVSLRVFAQSTDPQQNIICMNSCANAINLCNSNCMAAYPLSGGMLSQAGIECHNICNNNYNFCMRQCGLQ